MDDHRIEEHELKELPGYIRWIELLIKWIIGVFITAIWAVVGFFFWIPILLRACLIYSAVLFASVVGSADIGRAMRSLNLAIRFYPRGFVLIRSSIFGSSLEDDVSESSRPFNLMSFFHIIFESIFSAFMWVVSLNLIGVIDVDILKYIRDLVFLIRNAMSSLIQSQ